MKTEDFEHQLLIRYVTGECTEKERTKVESRIAQDENYEKKFRAFKRILDISDTEDRFKIDDMVVDTNKNWEELRSRLTKETNFGDSSADEANKSTLRVTSIHSPVQRMVRVAAILLIAGLMGVLSYQNLYQTEPDSQEPVFREITTENAQRANLTLEDGTKVMLNAGSNLRLPTEFEADVREVFLKGEAYFEVVNKADKPFIIHSRGSLIEVLGTSFAVRSYPEDDQVRVVVEEGRVSFKAEQKAGPQTILSESQLGVYELNEKSIRTRTVSDMQLYMSWRKGYLKFNKAPMSHVAKELERRYGVNVTFENSKIKDELLTSFLKSRSIKNVLNVIAMTLDIEYRLSGRDVVFYTE